MISQTRGCLFGEKNTTNIAQFKKFQKCYPLFFFYYYYFYKCNYLLKHMRKLSPSSNIQHINERCWMENKCCVPTVFRTQKQWEHQVHGTMFPAGWWIGWQRGDTCKRTTVRNLWSQNQKETKDTWKHAFCQAWLSIIHLKNNSDGGTSGSAAELRLGKQSWEFFIYFPGS